MAWTHDEILELMIDTVVELDQAIQARPSGKKDVEITLVSSGFRIVQVETDEEALFWQR